MRILRGETFYRDLDAYAMPGASYLLAAVMHFFGDDLAVARALAGVLFCGTLFALYAIALRLLDRRAAALFALSLFGLKFLAWPMWTAYFYGDVALCFAWTSVALLLYGMKGDAVRLRLVVAAGFTAGVSLLCKQNLGVYLGLASAALLLAPGAVTGRAEQPGPHWRHAGVFAAGLAAPVGLALGAFAAAGTLGAMLTSAFVRPFTSYLTTSAVPFLPMLSWWELGSLRGRAAASYIPPELWEMLMLDRLPGADFSALWWILAEILSRALYTAVPVAIVLALVLRVRLRRQASPRDTRLLALAPLALAVWLSALPRADVLHVLPVLPALLLLLYGLWRRATACRATVFEAGALAVFLGLCAAGALDSAAQRSYPLRLPRAQVWVRPVNAWNETLVKAIEREIPEGAPFFVYGQEASLYHLSGRFSPWPFVQLYPGMAGGDGGRALRERLEREPPRLVVRGMKKLPGLPALQSYTSEVDAFLKERYVVVPGFFRGGPGPTPPPWVVQVLRLREGGAS